MAHIQVSTTVHACREDVLKGFEIMLAGGQRSPAGRRIELRAPLGHITQLRHAADVSYIITRDPSAEDTEKRAIAVHWEPSGGGPFPTMWGFITLHESGAESTEMIFDGQYAPPLGTAGAVFDAVLGEHIANSTASALLYEMGRSALRIAYPSSS